MNDTRNKAGIWVVLIVAAVLITLIVILMNKQPEDPGVIQEGDWQFENQWYNYDTNIKTILFIGVADGSTAGVNREVKYLSLVAYNELEEQYSILNIDPGTATNVRIKDAQGTTDGEIYYGRIADAQTYGDGGRYSCENTAQSVKELLNYVSVDHVICIHVGSQKPAFTSDPLTQLSELISESETNETGGLVTSIVYSDINRNRLSDYWIRLNYCTHGEQYAIEGHWDDNLFVPDDHSLKCLIRDLYCKKAS